MICFYISKNIGGYINSVLIIYIYVSIYVLACSIKLFTIMSLCSSNSQYFGVSIDFIFFYILRS